MSAAADAMAPTRRNAIINHLGAEAGVWLFVFKTLLAYYLTGWLAMRVALPQPSTAMLTVVIVANRHSGMVLAKSFNRAIGTLIGAGAAILIASLFPQERVLFLLALSLWIGLCAGGAALYRNFTSYGFVLAGYTAALVAVPVIDKPPLIFDSAVARASEVLLGVLVAGVVNDTVFPSRLRDVLQRSAQGQFAHLIEYVRRSASAEISPESIEKAHVRIVGDAVALESLRSSVIFEDPESRGRSGLVRRFNHEFMAASTSLQSLHHLMNRLRRNRRDAAARALIELYAPIGTALDRSIETTDVAAAVLPRFMAMRRRLEASAQLLRSRLILESDLRDFDAGAALVGHFTDELLAHVRSAVALQSSKVNLVERIRFSRGNDFLGAGLDALRTMLVILSLAVFWLSSAWPAGPTAMMVAAVVACLVTAAGNPRLAAQAMTIGWTFGVVAAFVCVFFVLSGVDGYGLLGAGSVPFLMVGVAMMLWPPLTGVGVGYSMGFSYLLSLKNPMVFDPVHFINDSIASVLGFVAAAIAFIVLPVLTGRFWLDRQLERLRRQVALAAEAPLAGLRHRFESVNHDLVSQIAGRTRPGSQEFHALLAWTFAVHETGRALIEMRTDLARRPPPSAVSRSVSLAIDALARFYRHPDAAGYLLARDTVAKALETARDQAAAHPLIDHLHMIRLAIEDRESVLSDYMPPGSRAVESAHAS